MWVPTLVKQLLTVQNCLQDQLCQEQSYLTNFYRGRTSFAGFMAILMKDRTMRSKNIAYLE
jgi:hypothetical protein